MKNNEKKNQPNNPVLGAAVKELSIKVTRADGTLKATRVIRNGKEIVKEDFD